MRLRRPIAQEELVVAPARSSLVAARHRPSHWPFAWHHHREWELTWIVRGTGRRHIGPTVEDFGPGDLVLLGGHLPHTWVSPPRPGTSVEAVVVQFPLDVAGPRWREVPEWASLAKLLDEAARGVVWPPDLVPEVRFNAVVACPPGAARLAALLGLLAELAALPHRTLLTATDRPGRRDDRWARLVEDAAAHPEALPPQAAAARRLGMAPAAFARAFHRRFGLVYRDWRARLRLEHACKALSSTEAPIADIAFGAGFASLSAFNRRFLATYGCSPRTWRRRATDGDGRAVSAPG